MAQCRALCGQCDRAPASFTQIQSRESESEMYKGLEDLSKWEKMSEPIIKLVYLEDFHKELRIAM